MKVRMVVAGATVLALAGCGGATAATSVHSPAESPNAGIVKQQQAASGQAAQVLARDNAAKAAFAARWGLVDWTIKSGKWDPNNNIGTQLTSIARYANSLKCSPALHSAMSKLIGDTVAFYFATKNVPTLAQLQADANAVQTVQ